MNQFIAARTDPQTARSYWTMGRSDSARAFRAARHHSRVVRILRLAIPLAVLLGLTVISLITYFNPLRMLTRLPIDMKDLVVSGTKITMERPHMSGFTRDQRAYEFTADAAAQDLTKPDIVELHNIRAKVEMQDKTMMTMSADNGIYDTKSETLKLLQNILLNSSTGYHGKLSEATVDVRKGNVMSEHPVELEMLQGTLNANRLEIVESGDLVRFLNGVDMTLMLNNTALPNSKPKTGAR